MNPTKLFKYIIAIIGVFIFINMALYFYFATVQFDIVNELGLEEIKIPPFSGTDNKSVAEGNLRMKGLTVHKPLSLNPNVQRTLTSPIELKIELNAKLLDYTTPIIQIYDIQGNLLYEGGITSSDITTYPDHELSQKLENFIYARYESQIEYLEPQTSRGILQVVYDRGPSSEYVYQPEEKPLEFGDYTGPNNYCVMEWDSCNCEYRIYRNGDAVNRECNVNASDRCNYSGVFADAPIPTLQDVDGECILTP